MHREIGALATCCTLLLSSTPCSTTQESDGLWVDGNSMLTFSLGIPASGPSETWERFRDTILDILKGRIIINPKTVTHMSPRPRSIFPLLTPCYLYQLKNCHKEQKRHQNYYFSCFNFLSSSPFYTTASISSRQTSPSTTLKKHKTCWE